MGGAYVAKPDVTVAADLPPGWDLIWPHPGPWPPGYTPALALGLAAQSTASPGATVSDITSTLTDQVDYVTTEPATQIRWTAAWDDTNEPLTFKLSGGGSFLASVSVDYADVGSDFWGAEPDFVFDTETADIGRSFTLTARSTPFPEFPGDSLSASAVITVVVPVMSARFTVAWSGTYGTGSAGFDIGGSVVGSSSIYAVWPGRDEDLYAWLELAPDDYGFEGGGGIWSNERIDGNSHKITATDIGGLGYIAFELYQNIWCDAGTSGTLSYTVELLQDGIPIKTETAQTFHDRDVNRGFWHSGWANVDIEGQTISIIPLR